MCRVPAPFFCAAGDVCLAYFQPICVVDASKVKEHVHSEIPLGVLQGRQLLRAVRPLRRCACGRHFRPRVLNYIQRLGRVYAMPNYGGRRQPASDCFLSDAPM